MRQPFVHTLLAGTWHLCRAEPDVDPPQPPVWACKVIRLCGQLCIRLFLRGYLPPQGGSAQVVGTNNQPTNNNSSNQPGKGGPLRWFPHGGEPHSLLARGRAVRFEVFWQKPSYFFVMFSDFFPAQRTF